MNDLARRFSYHHPSNVTVAESHDLVRTSIHQMARILSELPESRERALAMTKLEEAMFWANAAIERYQQGFPSLQAATAHGHPAAPAVSPKPTPDLPPVAETMPAPN